MLFFIVRLVELCHTVNLRILLFLASALLLIHFLHQAITGDSVVLKFEKARRALEDGLRRVEDIVPQSIGCQVTLNSCF